MSGRHMSIFPTPQSRMAALDCLRGLMLAIVLADHIDFMALTGGTIRNWTLIGLGFSDAADVFVFLSGFVFGLAYGKRIQREGRWSSLKHGLFRTLQIYIGFVVCVVCAGLLKIGAGTMTWTTQSSEWLANMYLDKQPPNTGILCLYIVLLPWLLLLFVTAADECINRLLTPGLGFVGCHRVVLLGSLLLLVVQRCRSAIDVC